LTASSASCKAERRAAVVYLAHPSDTNFTAYKAAFGHRYGGVSLEAMINLTGCRATPPGGGCRRQRDGRRR